MVPQVRARAHILGYIFGVFCAFAAPNGYKISDSDIGYFALFAANAWIRRPDIRIFRDFGANEWIR